MGVDRLTTPVIQRRRCTRYTHTHTNQVKAEGLRKPRQQSARPTRATIVLLYIYYGFNYPRKQIQINCGQLIFFFFLFKKWRWNYFIVLINTVFFFNFSQRNILYVIYFRLKTTEFMKLCVLIAFLFAYKRFRSERVTKNTKKKKNDGGKKGSIKLTVYHTVNLSRGTHGRLIFQFKIQIGANL